MENVGELTKNFDKNAINAQENRGIEQKGSGKPRWMMRLAKAFGIGAVGVAAVTNPMVHEGTNTAIEKGQTAEDHMLNAKDEMVDKITTGVSHVEEAKNDVVDKITTAADKVTTAEDHTVNAIIAPIEGTKDVIENVLGQEDPSPRNPDEIFVGKVLIDTGRDLNIRKSPLKPGPHEQDNKSDWENVKLAQKVIKDGQINYIPVEGFQKGAVIEIENPEIVLGQNTGGGMEKGQWIELYSLDEDGNPHARYVNFQKEAEDNVQIISGEGKTIKAEKVLQNDKDGVSVTIHSDPLPEKIGEITIQPPQPQN